MRKKISVLGSTGSVGLNTFKIIDKKKKYFKIYLLSANKNFSLICKQIRKYKPEIFVINNLRIFEKVKKKFKKKIKIYNNFSFPKVSKSDITISAIPGLAGLHPTLFMVKNSKKILIANKEAIICGWELIKKTAKQKKTKIIPIDSEHFSILKLIDNQNLNDIKKIYITASGGPFLDFNLGQLKNIDPKEAIKHPKWKMGKKISVDSATLMNKLLELIEAQRLFNLPEKKIEILIHPESLVHAIVEFKNGLTKFIYHETSMIIPLANGIFDNKLEINNFLKLSNNDSNNDIIKNLTFKKVSKKNFPIIHIKNRINEYPSSPIILNASNEILVDQFLQKKIPFLSIIKIIMTILNDRNYKKYAIRKPKNINQINEIDAWARQKTLDKIKLK